MTRTTNAEVAHTEVKGESWWLLPGCRGTQGPASSGRAAPADGTVLGGSPRGRVVRRHTDIHPEGYGRDMLVLKDTTGIDKLINHKTVT